MSNMALIKSLIMCGVYAKQGTLEEQLHTSTSVRSARRQILSTQSFKGSVRPCWLFRYIVEATKINMKVHKEEWDLLYNERTNEIGSQNLP
jgi:hypothetical protein